MVFLNKLNSFNIVYCLLIILQTIGCFGLFDSNFSQKDPAHGHNQKRLSLTEEDLQSSLTYAEDAFEKLKRLENSISNSRVKIRHYSISFAQLLDSLPNNQSKEYDKVAQIVLKASSHLYDIHCANQGMSGHQCGSHISEYSIPESEILSDCRSYSHNRRGINTYRRLLRPYYSDGLHKIPHDRSPSPKNISETLFRMSKTDSIKAKNPVNSEGILDPLRNIALVQWAQFIEHDLVKTVVHTMGNNKPIECCERDSTSPPPRYVHPSCDPLKYENGSEFFCFNYVRSAVGLNSNCKFGAAEQLNQATNALDLSQLYGSTDQKTNSLRTLRNGELLSTDDPIYSTLPLSNDNQNYCMSNSTDGICYRTGDTRVNLNPYATTLYTIFLRSHNQIARVLHRAHRSWKDEKLFQIARRLNVDIYNKIIFEELAPVILGEEMANRINSEDFLSVDKNGAVSNEFATAGIRFYYSMMPGDLFLKENSNHVEYESNAISNQGSDILRLKNEFYKPRNLSENNEFDRIMHAILNQNAMAMDTGYVGDVTKYMYRFKHPTNPSIGTDILALDINRGRDHGLSKYIKYLEACTETKIESWESLEAFIKPSDLSRLKTVYGSIGKIDLIVGAVAERPVPDATVGPTFSCIIGEQLSNTRRTAPHFFERESEKKYRSMVSQHTAARLICDTTQLNFVPRNIFYKPSESNQLISCSDFKTLPKLTTFS